MKRQHVDKPITVILASLLMLTLVSCSIKQSEEEKREQSMMERIAVVDGVISVEIVENNRSE